MYVFEEECEFAGIEPKKVASIARRISRAATEARKLGILVFGGSGSGSLRWLEQNSNRETDGRVVLAHLDGAFDGGDGAEHVDSLGITRGENA